MKSTFKPRTFAILILIVLFTISCDLISGSSTDTQALEQTQIALGVEQTSLALQHEKATLDAQAQVQEPGEESQPANEVPPTYTPLPTYTPYPTDSPEQPTAEPPPTEAPEMSMEERIRASNVLIYEDIWDEYALSGDRRVTNAVNAVGFSGGRVINVGDAMGDFKSHLLSGTQWDLIIISVEVRDSIQGEFWEYMIDHLNRNVAMIAEVWYLDDTGYGKIAPILSKCGIAFHKDWVRNPGYDVLDYSILNLDTTHPIFNTPNSGISLVTPNIYWMFDAGDMLKLGPGGDAKLLAGLYYSHKNDYGVIAECMEGRVIFQTFSTHDYRIDQTTALWQNYIVYTLTNHYEKIAGQ